MNKEEVLYKPLPGFKGLYSIGNDGSIIRHKGNIKIIAQNYYSVRQKGITSSTLMIRIMHKGILYQIPLARTVANLFIPNPDPTRFTYIDYIDGDRNNCHYKNLVWVEHKNCINKKSEKKFRFCINKDNTFKWT